MCWSVSGSLKGLYSVFPEKRGKDCHKVSLKNAVLATFAFWRYVAQTVELVHATESVHGA